VAVLQRSDRVLGSLAWIEVWKADEVLVRNAET